MSSHSVSEAKNRLPELIDRALKGEEVVITRHGNPVVALKPVRPPARPVSKEGLDWLRARRAKLNNPKEDAATLVRKMRDEEWR